MGRPDTATNSESFTLEDALNKYETERAVAAQRREDEAQRRKDGATNFESEVDRLRTALFDAISQAQKEVNVKKPSRLALTIEGSGLELNYEGRSVTITIRIDSVLVMYTDNPGQLHSPSDWQLSINKPADGTGKPCQLVIHAPSRKLHLKPLVDSVVDREVLHRFLAGILIRPLVDEELVC